MDLTQQDWSSRYESDDNAFLLDVRTQEEYDDGHIPNATLLDIRQPQSFMDALQEMDPPKTIMFIAGQAQEAVKPAN